jgi:hypothetical protein
MSTDCDWMSLAALARGAVDKGALAYKYTSFCIKYRAFALRQQRSMRQIHIAGEKLFVDYAGSTVPITCAATGEITQAQIFVATLGASNYTYACATARQTTADWIGAQVQALEFIGGVPRLIVPDQTRALIKTPDRYDPEPRHACATAGSSAWPNSTPPSQNCSSTSTSGPSRSCPAAGAAPSRRLMPRRCGLCPPPATPSAAGRPPRSTSTTTSSSRATTTACRTGWSAPGSMCASPAACWNASHRTSAWPATP